MNKMCPFKFSIESINEKEFECEKEACALWITGYTSESRPISCCTFEFMALKNSEGHYQV